MTRELTIRALSLYGPMAIAGALWWWRKGDRVLGAATLLACAWCAPALLILHRVAVAAGWWTFNATGGLFAGMPVDLYLGWILLWGAIPALAFPSLPIAVVALVMLWLDLLLMPLCSPVLRLGPSWWTGEAIAVALVLLPAQLLARWTLDNRHVGGRAALQVAAFSGLVLLVAPTAVLEQTGGTWQPLLDRPRWWTSILVQLLMVPALVGVSAVQEFATRGGGTPLPYDPPRRLVWSGPYAYVANPMQLSLCLVWIGWAWMLGSWWMLAGSVIAIAYSAGLAAWHEDEELTARFGNAWTVYRRHVRPWWPRWRPHTRSNQPARLYVAETCEVCSDVGRWLKRRGLIGLDVVAAETFGPRELFRMTYVAPDGSSEEEGIAAFGRALEHVNLAWAWVGMLIRLPLLRPALQFLVDSSGGYSRRAGARSHCASGPAPTSG